MLLPIRKLEDSEAAEQYCADIGRPDAYMQLGFPLLCTLAHMNVLNLHTHTGNTYKIFLSFQIIHFQFFPSYFL